MNTNTDDRTIKQIIKQELPVLMKMDKKWEENQKELRKFHDEFEKSRRRSDLRLDTTLGDKAREAANKLGVKIYSFAEDIQDEFTDHSG